MQRTSLLLFFILAFACFMPGFGQVETVGSAQSTTIEDLGNRIAKLGSTVTASSDAKHSVGIYSIESSPFTIADITVNEGSDWAVFAINGTVADVFTLILRQESGAGKANLGISPTIQVWNGTSWIAYAEDDQISIPAGGTAYARVNITNEQDNSFEGAETFQLEVVPIPADVVGLTIYDANFQTITLDSYTRTGTEGAVGTTYRKTNAITIDGQAIDVLITIDAKSNVGSFTFDNNGSNASRFQPEINSTSSSGSFVDFSFEFFLSGTSTRVGIKNFVVNPVDVDGISSTNKEFVELSGISSYQLGTGSGIGVSAPGTAGVGFTRFEGIDSSLSGITFDNTASFIAFYSNPVASFDARMGVTGSSSSARLFSMSIGSTLGTFDDPSSNNVNPILATATITDDGTGSYWIGDNLEPATSAELTTAGITLDDDRVLLVDDTNTAFVNEGITGSVATNDNTVPGTTYSALVAVGGNPSADFPVLASDGSYTFTTSTPGVYTFTFDICAPGITAPNCEQGTLTITVIDPLDATNPPVANTDTYIGIAGTNLSGDVVLNDQDFSGTGITVTALNGAALAPLSIAGGTLTLASDGTFTLASPTTPGNYSFTYTIEDGNGETATATVFFTIYAAASDNVVLAADDYKTTTQGSAVSGNLLSNDSQLDNTDALLVVDPNDATNTTTIFTLTDADGNQLAIDPSDGSYTFTPDPTFSGNTSFSYEAIGTGDVTASATAYFTVRPSTGSSNPDINTAFVGESRTGSVATNDDLPTGTTYSALTAVGGNPSADVPVLASDGSYTFTTSTPGVYTFTFDICAPGISAPNCEEGTLVITVLAADASNAPPVANTDFAVGIQGSAVTLKTLANDDAGTAGAALNPSTLTITAGTPDAATEGSLSVNATTGDITFTPVAGFTGTVSYTYQVCDTNTPSACATATQTVTIYATGSANVVAAADDYNLTYQGATASGNVLSNDTQVKTGTALSATPQVTPLVGVGTFTLLADGTYTFVPDPAFTGNTSFVYQVTGTDGVTASATVYISVAETPTFNWTGAGALDNWCDPANWDKGTVPSTAVNVDIKYDATNPTVKLSGTCDLCINNLDVQENATLEVDGIRLCVTGDVNSAGLIDGTGSIHLNGTTLQTITGEFNITNLELDNAAGATITAGAGNMVQITESLKMTRGTLTTNNNLRLMSDANGDAYMAPISDAECGVIDIVGSVRIQKFVDGGNRAFRFISHPFDGTISLQQVRDYVHITGEGLDFNDTGNPSAFWYNTAGGDQSQTGEDAGWVPVSSTNIGDWFKGRAVRMMFRGPRTQAGVVGDDDYNPSVVTYELIGEVNFCEQILTGLVRSGNPGDGSNTDTGDGLVGSSAFNFIGNPFPAAIDLKTIPLADRADLSGAYYLWQPRTGVQDGKTVFGPGGGRGGNYVTEPFTGGTAALGQLASGTGFFVFALVNNATIRFTEANKLAQKSLDPGAAVTFRTDQDPESRYGSNSLQLALKTEGNDVDRVLLSFNEEAYGIVDRNDATKFANPAINFFTLSEDEYALAIDHRPWVEEEEQQRIALYLQSPAMKYTLEIPDFDLEPGRKLSLYDRFTEETITLSRGQSYSFEVTDDPKSRDHRFDLIMGGEVVTSLQNLQNELQVILMPNPAEQQVAITFRRRDELNPTEVRIVDMQGLTIHRTTVQAEEEARVDYPVNSLRKGVYLIEVRQGGVRQVKKLVVK